jgi:predicted nucleic acid-binding protein
MRRLNLGPLTWLSRILDDRRAVRGAKALDIPYTGILGVLLAANRGPTSTTWRP